MPDKNQHEDGNTPDITFSSQAIDVCLKLVEETSKSTTAKDKLDRLLGEDDTSIIKGLVKLIQFHFHEIKDPESVASEVLLNYRLASKKFIDRHERVSRSKVFASLI